MNRVGKRGFNLPDGEVPLECMRQGFEEVLELAGDHRPVELPLRVHHR